MPACLGRISAATTLTLERYGAIAQRAAGLEHIDTLPGRHFFQEEQWPALSDRVAAFVTQSNTQ